MSMDSLVCTALLVLPVVASAQPVVTDETDLLIREGVVLRKEGQDEEALERFTRAFERSGSARARAQMGLAAQALGRWVDAEAHLRAAMAMAEDPWVEKNRAALTDALVAVGQHLGSLVVKGGVPGAEVWVGGKKVATLPMDGPVRVVAGETVLEIHASVYEPLRRPVTIPVGSLAREPIDLVPIPVAERARAVRGGPLAWAATAGAVVFVAGGVTGHVLREQAAARWNDDARCPLSKATSCPGVLSDVNSFQALAIAGYLVGGALAVASALLFIVPRASLRRQTASLTGTFGPWGIVCAGRF
jgi:hypothetical protein